MVIVKKKNWKKEKKITNDSCQQRFHTRLIKDRQGPKRFCTERITKFYFHDANLRAVSF